ncbi:MAG TPA: hypothetical protein IAB97_06675 [Candidatus Choladousia intestinipullorum]|nr:hypothetical protein [Candidatus Choladousia intestinipullorum]
MEAKVYKGTVLSVEDDGIRAAPSDDIDNVSRRIGLAGYLTEPVQKGDEVVYCVFPDMTGLILAKIK